MKVLCRLYPLATFITSGLIMHRMVPPMFRIDLSAQLFFLVTQTHPEMCLTIFSVFLNLAKPTMKIRHHRRLIHTSILVTWLLFCNIRAMGTKHNVHDKHMASYSSWGLYPLLMQLYLFKYMCYSLVFRNELLTTSSHPFTSLLTTDLPDDLPLHSPVHYKFST